MKANDTMHIAYNGMSSQPDCLGVEVLGDVKELVRKHGPQALRRMGANLVDAEASGLTVREAMDTYPGFADHIAAMYPGGVPSQAPDLDRSDSEAWNWWGDFDGLAEMFAARVYQSNEHFPIYSGHAEWGYLLDLDRDNGPDRAPGVLEVYRGFQDERPAAGAWANRPTAEEEAEDYQWHLDWCAETGRDPWMSPVAADKACAPIATFALDSLPSEAAMTTLNDLRDKTLDDTLVPFAAAGVVAGIGPVFESWTGVETGASAAS